MNSADFLSKTFLNVNDKEGHLTEIANSKPFREGYDIYLNDQCLEHTFLTVKKDEYNYQQMKVSKNEENDITGEETAQWNGEL